MFRHPKNRLSLQSRKFQGTLAEWLGAVCKTVYGGSNPPSTLTKRLSIKFRQPFVKRTRDIDPITVSTLIFVLLQAY